MAEFTSACVYDRSGYGWSDLSPRTPTAGEACDQLERALESAGLAPPFVLVGHSFGGYVLQIFDPARHPASVAGLVLADSITWPEWRAPGRAQSRALAGGALFAGIGAVVAALGVVRFASMISTSLNTGPSLIPINEKVIRSSHQPQKPRPEKCLILGWNRSGATIVRELDNYVPKGSLLTIVADVYGIEKQLKAQGIKLVNQKLIVKDGETTDRALLNTLKVEDYNHVIVLAYSTLEPHDADAKTLVTLLHLRDMAGHNATPFSIVSEMLDIRNRELAEVTQVDDFIVSEHLISLMLAQLSENAELYDVFDDIFDSGGSEIYLKPIRDYVETGTSVNFYTVVEAARRRAETAIGYRLVSESKDAEKSYGVHTNPQKSKEVVFTPEDKVIVIAEE